MMYIVPLSVAALVALVLSYRHVVSRNGSVAVALTTSSMAMMLVLMVVVELATSSLAWEGSEDRVVVSDIPIASVELPGEAGNKTSLIKIVAEDGSAITLSRAFAKVDFSGERGGSPHLVEYEHWCEPLLSDVTTYDVVMPLGLDGGEGSRDE